MTDVIKARPPGGKVADAREHPVRSGPDAVAAQGRLEQVKGLAGGRREHLADLVARLAARPATQKHPEPNEGSGAFRARRELAMDPRYRLMKTLQDERLRAAARDHRAAEARRARTAGRDHAAATRAAATARGAAAMPGKQGAAIGLGIALGAILLFPQGIIPAVLKLAHARGRVWFLPLYLPKPLQWPACLVMIILGVAVYCYVLWTMRQLKKSSRQLLRAHWCGRTTASPAGSSGPGTKQSPALGSPAQTRRPASRQQPPLPPAPGIDVLDVNASARRRTTAPGRQLRRHPRDPSPRNTLNGGNP